MQLSSRQATAASLVLTSLSCDCLMLQLHFAFSTTNIPATVLASCTKSRLQTSATFAQLISMAMEPDSTSANSTSLVEQCGLPPPLTTSIEKYFKKRTYSCGYSGSYRSDEKVFWFRESADDRQNFEPNIATYLPLVEPKLTKAGKPMERQPTVPAQPLGWWKAQCRFRGLAVSGTIKLLQERLRSCENRDMTSEMARFYEVIKAEYIRMNVESVEKCWLAADQNEKARLWPRRLLHDLFIANLATPNNEVLSVVLSDHHEMVGAAQRLNLFCEDTKLDVNAEEQRLIVVGRDRKAVSAKTAEKVREGQRERARAREEKKDALERKFAQAETLKRKIDQYTAQTWDVSGSWTVICPDIRDVGGHRGDRQSCLEIKLTRPSPTGLVQMYAEFDFLVIWGILRFVNPDVKEPEISGSSSRLVEKGEKDGLGFHQENFRFEEDFSSEPPTEFMLPTGALPSSETRNFKYRWRGEETGEGEIQLGSDEKLYSITFQSPNTLTGVFHSNYVSAEFRAFKEETGRPNEYAMDPGYLWSRRSEAAYERARVNRWH